MSLHSWLRSLRARTVRNTARRIVHVPQANQLAEVLEPRCLLAVTPLIINGTDLLVQLESSDNVVIQADASGNLEVLSNGSLVIATPTIAVNTLTSISVFGGDGPNRIDLTNVTTAAFNVNLTVTVNGGDGGDTILGSEFADSLIGGNGADSITGALADDTLEGGNGIDTLAGGVGNDSLFGGDGADSINGDAGNDTVVAGNGADCVSGGDGLDSLNGSDGTDTLSGNAGEDTLNGDNGNDSLLGGTENDVISGGNENDFASGGDGDDTITGNAGNDSLDGDAGLDSIDGNDGNDSLAGGDDNDLLNAGSGNDFANGNAGHDTVFGGAGNDLLAGGDDEDTIQGQAGNDTLFGGAATDSLDGGAGNDLIQGLGAFVSIFDAGIVAEGDSGSQLAVFVVSLAQTSAITVQVDFATLDGTALAGIDYQATSGTLTFAPGQTQATVSVPVLGDLAGEGLESFSVRLTPRQNSLIEVATATASITDNDVSISISDASAAEGDVGQSTLRLTVSLNRPSTVPVTVSFATVNGDAVAGLDYVANSGTITFAPNTTTATINVSVFGENVGENSESFFVNLSNPSGAVLADSQGVATIVDDDGGPLVGSVIPSGFIYDYGHEDSHDHDHDHDHDGGQAGGGGELTPQGFQIGNRWTVTATDGPGLGPGDATTLTWGIVPDGTTTAAGCGAAANQTSNLIAFLDGIYNETATGPDVRNRTWFQLFQSVFDNFESFSGLRFVYEPNDDRAAISGAANGVLGVRADIRVVGHNIPGNTIGCNFFPNFGDMALASNSGFFNFLGFNSRGLRNTIAHELGHGIGFNHVVPVDQTKLMEPSISFAFDGPQQDDVLATNRNYGDRNEAAGGNDTSATATVLGTFAPATSTSDTRLSIDDDSDADFYAFTLSSDALTTITVTPTGTSYLQGPQSGVPSPTTFNPLIQSDLSFVILASDGTTVLATAASNGLGIAEQVAGLSLAAGDYFVRVNGAQDMVQMYDISLAAAAPPSPPAPPSAGVGDSMNGGDGNDTLSGADGPDTMNGMAGNDSLLGGGGNDSMQGGAGNDTLDGGGGGDTLDGQGGNDRVAGGDGSDTFVWNGNGDGQDTLSSISGYDRVRVQGTAAANNYVVSQVSGQIRITDGTASLNVSPIIQVVDIFGGEGNDTITINALDRVRTATVLTVNGEDGNDRINSNGVNIGFIRISLIGGLGDDTLTGSSGIDSLDGGDGDDSLNAQGGNDLVFGGIGDDTIIAGTGNDRVLGGDGNDSIDAGAGNDSVAGEVGADTISGSDGNDTLDGGDGTDSINGGSGNDSILGGNEADDLNGSTGNDTVRGGANDDTIIGENGNDSLFGEDGNDSILGYDGDDTLSGGDGDDTLDGMAGNDLVGGGNGDDLMNGAAGNDTLTGGDGNDTIAGGAGNDVLLGDEGDDSLNGQGSTDIINPGEGANTVLDPITEIDTTFVLSAALLAALA